MQNRLEQYHLCLCSDKLVRIWELKGEETSELDWNFIEKGFSPIDGHKYSINHVEFSPCGSMLATCSLDGTTMIWDTEVSADFKNFKNYHLISINAADG